ncbi:MAG: N-acetyltransferase family protein [Patescibacteria group bacterium]
MTMQIEPTTINDLPAVNRLYATTWLATYPSPAHGISQADIEHRVKEMRSPERLARMRERFVDLVKDPARLFRVARVAGRVVGVLNAIEHESAVELKSLYVLPESQGQGVGSALMEAFVGWANPEKPCLVNVVTYNTTAIRFYEHWGFEDTGKRFTEERFIMPSGNALPEMEMRRELR